MQHEHLVFFAKYIEQELGIVYADHNYFQLQNRLEEIAKLYSLCNISELYTKALQGLTGSFKQLVLDIATNNETSFFRDPKVFHSIEKNLIPHLITKVGSTEKIKIWSAASSSGQEAYSTAMLLHEMGHKKSISNSYEILGTDISERILEKAKSGKYSQLDVQRGLSPQLLLKYFKKDDQDYWNIGSEIKDHVHFQSQNLKLPLRITQKFHIILCRNVLIYQKVESKAEIVKRISEHLVPGGYLILGAGESLIGVSKEYDPILSEGVVVYQLKNIHAA